MPLGTPMVSTARTSPNTCCGRCSSSREDSTRPRHSRNALSGVTGGHSANCRGRPSQWSGSEPSVRPSSTFGISPMDADTIVSSFKKTCWAAVIYEALCTAEMTAKIAATIQEESLLL